MTIEYRLTLEMTFDNSTDRDIKYDEIKEYIKNSAKMTKDEYVRQEYVKLNKPFTEEF